MTLFRQRTLDLVVGFQFTETGTHLGTWLTAVIKILDAPQQHGDVLNLGWLGRWFHGDFWV